MSSGELQLEKPYNWVSGYDRAIELLLGCALVFGPLALGSVQPWSELVLLLLVTGMVAAFFGRLLFERHSAGCRWSWTYLPLVLFLALVAAQLLPLPWGVLGTLSPVTLSIKQGLLADLPGGLPTSSTLSFYPYATWHDLRILLAVSGVFVIVTSTFRTEAQLRRLLAVIAIAGALVALVALGQDLSGNRQIYGRFATFARTAGPFQNYNHYSQFANLSIGAALALLLLRLDDRVQGRQLTWRRFSDIFQGKTGWIAWSLLVGILLAAGTIALSTSRMGFLSMLIAAIVAAFAARRAHGMKGRGSIFALLGFAFFCVLLLLGFEAIYDRLATLQQIEGENTPYSARWQTLVDLVPVWKQFPVFGIGMGSHPFAFHMFDHSGDFKFTGHVENEYAQLLEETGILGIGLVLAFALLLARACRATLRGNSRFATAVAIGMGYGLTAILTHSLTDFAQHVPSIALLTAVVCGILVNISPARWHKQPEVADAQSRRREAPRTRHPLFGFHYPPTLSHLSRGPLILTSAAALAAFAILLPAVASAYSATQADSAFTMALGIEARLADSDWQGDDWDYARLILTAEKAARLQPGNIQYATALNTYRWRAISRARDQATGQTVYDQEALGYAKQIAAEISAVRVLCPTYGPPYSLLGQIEHFILSDPAGPAHIATGYKLAPYDVACCYAAGLLDAQGGRLDDSLTKFRRLGDVGAIQNAAAVYSYTCNRPDLAVALAGDDPARLLAVANVLQQYDASKELAARARAEAAARLRTVCAAPDAPAHMLAALAGLCAAQDDHSAAAAWYRRAVDREYGRLDWHLALARSLAKAGDVAQAMNETRICLRLRPGYGPAKRLLGELSLLPGAPADRE